MRIACLQFAPQVGTSPSNMARAEAVLAQADPDDLDALDLLVLPEMAFSGMELWMQQLDIYPEQANTEQGTTSSR